MDRGATDQHAQAGMPEVKDRDPASTGAVFRPLANRSIDPLA
jgi:hypothetical protein